MYLTEAEVLRIRSKAQSKHGANAEGRTRKGVNPPDPKSVSAATKHRENAQKRAKNAPLPVLPPHWRPDFSNNPGDTVAASWFVGLCCSASPVTISEQCNLESFFNEVVLRLGALIHKVQMPFRECKWPMRIDYSARERKIHRDLKASAFCWLLSMGYADAATETGYSYGAADVGSVAAGIVVECGNTPAERLFRFLEDECHTMIILPFQRVAEGTVTGYAIRPTTAGRMLGWKNRWIRMQADRAAADHIGEILTRLEISTQHAGGVE